MSRFNWPFWTAFVCWLLALISLGLALWANEASVAGAWVSAVCGWGIVMMRSRDD